MTTRWPRIVATVFCVLLAVATSAARVAAITGNEYRQLPELHRLLYVSGVLDGWVAVEYVGRASKAEAAPIDAVLNVARCLAGKKMTRDQTRAIVDKYVREHPTEWHQEITAAILAAMIEPCTR